VQDEVGRDLKLGCTIGNPRTWVDSLYLASTLRFGTIAFAKLGASSSHPETEAMLLVVLLIEGDIAAPLSYSGVRCRM
jgi:hypothetical protein